MEVYADLIEMSVNVKSVAGKKSKIKTMIISYDESIFNVRGLIEATVAWCVSDYNQRRESGELLTTLSTSEIEDKAAQGKVSFGVNYGEKNADVSKATDNALEAFTDGIAVIFADGKRLEALDEAIDLTEIKSLTFVKLTMLAGRMW